MAAITTPKNPENQNNPQKSAFFCQLTLQVVYLHISFPNLSITIVLEKQINQVTAEELEHINTFYSISPKMRPEFLNCSFVWKNPKQERTIELGITPSHLSSYLAGWRKISDEQKFKLIELLKLQRVLSLVAKLKEK